MNYKPNEFAKLIGVSVRTLQRWDKEKILIANRNPSGRRFYTEEQVKEHNPNIKGESINMIDASVETAVKITNGENVVYISEGMVVDIVTDCTEFEECYLLREVLSVNEDEIEVEDDNIPWEYITSISICKDAYYEDGELKFNFGKQKDD